MDRKQHLYEHIWAKEAKSIIPVVRIGSQSGKPLAGQPFFDAGNRKNYGFKLVINKGKVVNNIKGSAVARDLADVLLPLIAGDEQARNKHFEVKMSKDFYLSVIPYYMGKPVVWTEV